MIYGGIFDASKKRSRLNEIQSILEDAAAWKNQSLVKALGQERSQLLAVVDQFDELNVLVEEADVLFELYEEAKTVHDYDDLEAVCHRLEKSVNALEFQQMFSNPMDSKNAYLTIQAGSGGTEAQDWAQMLLRMYLRWGEAHDCKTTIMEISSGDVAGIKGATVKFEKSYAYGWLRTETGVHRLVRKSPFDSGNRRHTSFASVFVYPEIDDTIQVDIKLTDLKIDTYRASGAGGQHVNTTDSAVRITHVPTGTIVQCQNERSQHQNRDQAMKQLRARLYELELKKQNAKKNALEASKADITWGSQIRSYVLDQSRIKDLRTGVEITNTQSVLDGDLDPFIEANLKAGVE